VVALTGSRPHPQKELDRVVQGWTDGPGEHGARADAEIEVLRRENAHLRGIVHRRAVIEQAKGALILRYGLDDDAAFAVLRRWSQHSNVKLHTIAETLVTVVCREGPRPPGDRAFADWLWERVHEPAPDTTTDDAGR
jgi:hypothetical protein